MKLQGLSIVFALIVLPLILVLTYYIQLQVDTITLQNAYDTKLLDSTYDAMSAFEINTANEDLSTVSDSLRTIIEASSNVFFNTLATNLGMSNASKSRIEPYIPSLLYTLYDGYYINAPTQVVSVLTDSDGNAVSVGDKGVAYNGTSYSYTEPADSETSDDFMKYPANKPPQGDYGQILLEKKGGGYTTNPVEAELKTKNVLKSYVPYSARYKTTNKDITVVYTLDNYVTIEGSIDNIYYTKSGYLIPNGSVAINEPSNLDLYNQNDAQKYIKEGKPAKITIGSDVTIELPGDGITYDGMTETIITLEKRIDTAYEYARVYDSISDKTEINATIDTFLNATGYSYTGVDYKAKLYQAVALTTNEINSLQYKLDEMDAVIYYVKAKIFSDWIYANLNDIEEQHITEVSGQDYQLINGIEEISYNFGTSTKKVFDVVGSTNNGVTEISIDSQFYTHKLNVIKQSIQYNLNTAMSTYNEISAGNKNYAMPVLSQEEWSKVLTNPSIVSFMQGYSCGLKIYNNYMIVSSTNNEISVDTNHIYFVNKDNFSDENTEYHAINCKKLYEEDKATAGVDDEYISFTSKEAKYDKIYDKGTSYYEYDHRNYACYDCINDGNYETCKLFDTLDANYGDYKNLRKAYYIGVGKNKNILYKMNAIENSQGYEIIYDKGKFDNTSTFSMNKIKAIEIVIGTIKTKDSAETVLNYTVTDSGDRELMPGKIYAVASNVTTDNKLYIEVDPANTSSSKVSKNSLNYNNMADNTTAYYSETPDGATEPTDITDDSKVFKNSIKYIRVIYK